MPEPVPRPSLARGAPAGRPAPHAGEPHPRLRPYHYATDEELRNAWEAAQVAADHWCRPALDRRLAEALGEDPRRPYRALDDLGLEAAEEPREEDPVSPAPVHRAICNGLEAALEAHYEGRDDVLVAIEFDLYYDALDERAGKVIPDLMVVFGVPKRVDTPKRFRHSYVLWKEPEPPSFALEVLSPSTWRRDMGLKRKIYASIGVRDYFVFDPKDHITPRLQGFGLHGGSYRPLPSEMLPGGMRGVYSAALGLYLSHEEPWPAEDLDPKEMPRVRWYDPAAGEYLGTPLEIARKEAAEARKEAEEARRAAESRIAELEARIREITS